MGQAFAAAAELYHKTGSPDQVRIKAWIGDFAVLGRARFIGSSLSGDLLGRGGELKVATEIAQDGHPTEKAKGYTLRQLADLPWDKTSEDGRE